VQSGDALIIEDARDHPLVCDNAAIADLGVIAYVGVPLIAPDGEVLGSFCAIDSRTRSWTTQDVADLTDLAAVAAVEIAARQYRREREQTEQEMDILVGELDHRIRNMLSVVQAIAKQTGTHTSSVKEFLDAFCGRLGGLAAAHATLMESRWRSASLQRIARGSLEVFLFDRRLRVALPERDLEPSLALALALVFHELATNATKYGALSVPEGRIHLNAEHETEPHLVLIWREEGGPPAAPPTKQGFGTRMLQACIAHHGGAVELDWSSHGLICRLRLPAG
jgi:two-component sensor histidine kinase